MVAVVNMVVDPAQMVRVEIARPSGRTDEVIAISCRFVPAQDSQGHRVIAVEIVTDPEQPVPASRYICRTEQLRRDLVPPGNVRRVRPYLG